MHNDFLLRKCLFNKLALLLEYKNAYLLICWFDFVFDILKTDKTFK